jgi:hypothetical protein
MEIMQNNISQFVSVCHSKNADVWKIASKYIIKNIKSINYSVIVPDSEVELFKSISHPRFNVIEESKYLTDFKYFDKIIPHNYLWRKGWYIQQYLKLAFSKDFNDNEIILIWDADTIPLKKLNFINKKGKLLFYTGIEFHKPYFTHIKNTLNLNKTIEGSFISQCMPLKASWVHHLYKELENKHKMKWDYVLFSNIDYSQVSGFSEYETLGTYFFYHFPNEVQLIKNKWSRYGNDFTNGLRTLNPILIYFLSLRFDYISFEAWHKCSNKKSIFKIIKNLLFLHK